MSEASPVMGGDWKDRIVAVLLLVFTATMWHFTADFPLRSQLFPRMILSALGILSVLLFARTFFSKFQNGKSRPFFINPRMFFLTLSSVIAYVLAVQWLGYFTATAVYIPAIALMLGQRGAAMIGVSTALFLIMIYLVFVVTFERPLPLEFWME